jgi:hypothetical protein
MVDICDKVDQKELSEHPEHLRGCTKLPLFDLVPIQNYIVPVLHILIGVGNAVVNAIYEFVDEHIERLLKQLIVARNNINTAKKIWRMPKLNMMTGYKMMGLLYQIVCWRRPISFSS